MTFDSNLNLTESDIAHLSRSYITPELARSAGIRRVDSVDGAEIVGRTARGGEDYAGLIFPYVWPGDSRPREYRLRRDYPDLEQSSNGQVKETKKYLSPPGRGNLLYFPPQTDPRYLQDTSIPAVVTEGEKKALALFRLFSECGEERLVIGLPGVWNWRGKVGLAENSKGQKRTVKGVIPDFGRILWQDREALIIFDSNVATNESVAAARRTLGIELSRRGARVLTVDLPSGEGVNGVDDISAIKGPDYVIELIKAAMPAIQRSSSEAQQRKPSQASSLVALATVAEFFHTPDGDAYATLPVNEHRETVALRSKGFRDWLAFGFYRSTGNTPNAQALQDAVNTLRGKAQFDSPEHEIHIRIAQNDGALYLDLCDAQWRVVEITRAGWRIIDSQDPPIRFRRTRGMLALPEPRRGGDVAALRDFVNVANSDWPLISAWLVAAFRPDSPFPLLALHGEQGSAKSTTARILRELIDPNTTALRGAPRNEHDLMIAAKNGWLISLDNLSNIPDWLSDALCRLATGGGFATRELYSDDEEILFNAMRPIIINGIEEVATRNDLLDRSIISHLPIIPDDERRNEKDLWPKFEAARPSILGALLDAVSVALDKVDSIQFDRLPRMADFALWAGAAEPALGLKPGAFIAAYSGNRAAANDLALEALPVAQVIITFMEREAEWTGTASELLKELNAIAGEDGQKQQGWPKSARVLGGALKRLAPNLRAASVNVVTGIREGHKGRRVIRLERVGTFASASAASSVSNAESAYYSDYR